MHIPSSKIKLQLFPINEDTRLGLEKDGYNPFLELSLSARKKISSVIRHLHMKWGSCSVAVGELLLFPYDIKLEKLPCSRRWSSNDSAVTAWEVYLAVQAPSLFRLRYGWCSNPDLQMCGMPHKSSPVETSIESACNGKASNRVLDIKNQVKELNNGHVAHIDPWGGKSTKEILLSDVREPNILDLPNDHVDDKGATDVAPQQSMVPWDDNLTNLSIGGLLSEISLLRKINGSDVNSVKDSTVQPTGQTSDISIGCLLSEASLQCKTSNHDTKSENKLTLQPIMLTACDISIGGLLSEASMLSNKRKLESHVMEEGPAQFQTPWDNCLTTLSIGDLLSDASLQAKADCKLETKESKSNLQPNACLADSFDAFVAAQLNTDSQLLKPTCHESSLSILDAEDTCHAFPFQRLSSSKETSGCSNPMKSKLFQHPKVAKVNNGTGSANDFSCQELKANPLPCSLGPIDEHESE